MSKSKKEWCEDADYTYNMTDFLGYGGITLIRFEFPNAAGGPLEFTTWLYKRKDGKVYEKNLEAELLQCYIDRDLDKSKEKPE